MPGQTRVTGPRVERRDLWAMLVIWLLSLAAKCFVLDPVGPLIFFDELLYKLGAEAVAGRGAYPSAQYPFLYPLLLAPALATGAGYDGIVVINALLSSTLVPACWLLARSCGAQRGWPSAVVAAVLPFHFTFPTQLMAENLLVPLFTFCLWYAVRARPSGWVSSFVFGLMLAGTYLTKYLALPAVPVMWAMWMFGLSRNGSAGRGLLSPALASLLGIAMLVAAWILFADANGIAVGAAFGGDVYDGHVVPREAITPGTILLWTVAYLAVLVLAVGPFLYPLFDACAALARSPVRRLGESAFYRLVLLCLLFLGGYLLVCVQHSAQLAMNHPDPQRIVGRYFMQLVPAITVIGMVQMLADSRIGRLRCWPAMMAALGLAGLAFLAHGVLYEDLVWNFPEWFAAIPLYSADILGYQPPVSLALLLALVLLGPIAAMGIRARAVLAIATVGLLAGAAAYVNQASEILTTSRPLHAKQLLPHVAKALAEPGSVLIVSEVPRVSGPEIKQALTFWGLDGDRVSVVGPLQTSGFRNDVSVVYRLVNEPLDVPDCGPAKSGAGGGAAALRERQQPRFPSARYGPSRAAEAACGSPTARLLEQYSYGRGSRTRQAYLYRSELPDAPETLAADERVRFSATPAEICPREGGTVVELSWDVPPDAARQVSIFVVSEGGGEKIFAMTDGSGKQETGPWVYPGSRFRLRDAVSGQSLAVLSVERSPDCQQP